MRILLDTHALLWALEANSKLSARAAAAVGNPANIVVISAVSIMEIALKYRIGKLPEAARYVTNWDETFAALAAEPLLVSVPHAALAGGMDIPHKDPFDRLLIAQSLVERVPLVTNEALFDSFGVQRLW